MSRLDTVAENSRAVVGAGPNGLSETWTYARLTSKINASPRTYDAVWTDFPALVTRGSHQQVYDTERAEFSRHSAAVIRCPDNAIVPALTQGDIVKDPEGVAWAILGIPSSGPGTTLYSLGRDEILLGDAMRGGGV